MGCQDGGLVKLGHAKLSRSITTTLDVSVRAIRLRESFEATISRAAGRHSICRLSKKRLPVALGDLAFDRC